MSTASCLPATIPLRRPWWVRWRDDLGLWLEQRRRAEQERDVYGALEHLSEETLRDIGAPEWLHERDRSRELWRLDRHTW